LPTSLRKRHRSAKEQRRGFFKRAGDFTPLLGVPTDAGVFVVRTGDQFGEGLFAKRSRSDLTALSRAVQVLREHGFGVAGTDFVDVGAHIGTTTVAALRLHGFGRAIAFEPRADNRTLLRVNLALNNVAELTTVLPIALGDREEEVALVLDQTRSGGAHIAVADDPGVRVPVRIATIDRLVDQGELDPESIGLLWIDAQGHEARVLAGADSLLASGVPLVAAVRPRKLAVEGQSSLFVDSICRHATHVVDLRAPNRHSPWTPTLRPSSDVEELVDAASPRTTDVLAF
jgi:FkbM family methyltransferase